MMASTGVEIVDERMGDGPVAQVGDRLTYNCRMFLHRGDEVPMNARQSPNLQAHMLRVEDVGCEGALPRSRNPYARLEIICNVMDQSVTCSEQKREFPEGLSSFCVQADL